MKSRPKLISLNKNEEVKFIIQTICYDDELLSIMLIDPSSREIKYQINYTYETFFKDFSVLPKSVKDELTSLINVQVFIGNLIAKNKIVLKNYNKDLIHLEFPDLCQAPNNAVYNVSILLEKAEVELEE